MRKASLAALSVTLVLIAGTGLASLLARRPKPAPDRVKPAVIRATLELSTVTDTSKALLTGYHYHLLKRFAADNGQQALIRLAQDSRGTVRLAAGETPVLQRRLKPGEAPTADALLMKADELLQQLITAEASKF